MMQDREIFEKRRVDMLTGDSKEFMGGYGNINLRVSDAEGFKSLSMQERSKLYIPDQIWASRSMDASLLCHLLLHSLLPQRRHSRSARRFSPCSLASDTVTLKAIGSFKVATPSEKPTCSCTTLEMPDEANSI